MTYNTLIDILCSDNVLNELKRNELELFLLIPELEKCKGFNQNNKWHIYDVYEHILQVVAGVENNKCLRLAALFHDIGKFLTYSEDENKIGHFYNHWNKFIEIFNKYQDKLDLTNEEILLITNLIFFHDVNINKMTLEEKDNMIRVIGIENIELLFFLKKADLLAQSPDYHYLLKDIIIQEKSIIKVKKLY